MSNLSVVKEIYNAFGRGDVPAILSHLSESVEWEYGGTEMVPWLKHGRGHHAASEFFAQLNALVFESFNPKIFLEGTEVVIVLVDLELTVKSTGKKLREEDEVHLWYFDLSRKVTRFRHRADTLQHYLANQPG